MPTPQEYILSFDFTSFTSQFSILQKSFTDFGDTLHKLAGQVSTDLKGIQEQANEIFKSLSNLGVVSEGGFQSFERHLKQTSGYLDDYQKKSSEIAQKLKDISNTDISKLAKAAGGGEQDNTADIAPGGANELKVQELGPLKELDKMKDEVKTTMEKLDALDEKFKGLDKKLEEAFKTVYDTLAKEAKQASSKAKSVMSNLTGGLISGGGILAMGLGFILLGEQEKFRKSAEAGEMLNVIEAGTSDLFAKSTRKMTNWFSTFQEKAHWYYGIGIQETQSVVKAMVDAGYTTDQIMDRFSKKLGEVGSNVVTLTLGIDKHFNLATGTAAQNVNLLVEKYGDSLDEAADKYTKLSFAAQRSGMGVSKFVDSVMSGSQALTQYGIDLNDVAHVMETLKKHYKDMGLDRQYAGGQAADALSGISQGIAGLGVGMQMIVSQRMYRGASALEARQKFMEGWSRVAEGKDQGFLIDAIKTAVGYAKEQTSGGRDEAIYFLQQQGFGFQAATAAVDIADKLEKGTQIQELSNKEIKALRESFLTEGKQVSELQKNQRDLIEGLSELGKGLLKVLAGVLGTLIAGFKFLTSLPAMLTMDSAQREAKFAEAEQVFGAQLDSIKSGFSESWKGMKDTGSALGDVFKDVFGDDSSVMQAINMKLSPEVEGGVSGALASGLATAFTNIDRLESKIGTLEGAMQSILTGDKKYLTEALREDRRQQANIDRTVNAVQAGVGWGDIASDVWGKLPLTEKKKSKVKLSGKKGGGKVKVRINKKDVAEAVDAVAKAKVGK